MPEGAVYVGRPTKWGNPYRPEDYKFENADGSPAPWNKSAAIEMAIRDYSMALQLGRLGADLADIEQLRGKDLACFCRLDQPCHADVLLELANPEVESLRAHGRK